jgi:3-methyl-2-oxobutanoate hydroxymethyltransferase
LTCVIYLFQDDICAEGPERPRHARDFGDLHAFRERIQAERRAALAAFDAAAKGGRFPAADETAVIGDREFMAYLDGLER